MSKSNRVNRRTFLTTGLLAGGGLLLCFSDFTETVPGSSGILPALPTPPTGFSPNAFLHIGEDDRIQILLTKVEMGQGIGTTLAMLIAEELDCDWRQIELVHAPPRKAYADPVWGQSTGGSSSTYSEFDRYRKVGATARIMLVAAAARRMGVQPGNCRTENSFVIAGDQRIRYGAVATQAATLPIPIAVGLRRPNEWKYIGQPQKRVDYADKVNGKAIYGIDLQFPGLLTAVVAHSPVFGGKVKSYEATRAKAVPGVRQVVEIPTGVAVIADHYWAAKLGRDALEIEWNLPAGELPDSQKQLAQYRRLSKTQGVNSGQQGDVTAALQKAVATLEAEYTVPYLAHAPMEPLNCTVQITENQCEVWAGNQNSLLFQEIVAKVLGFLPRQVTIHTPLMGGSFGRRGSFDADWVVEAVHIARASGRSVKLVWSREDDIRGGYYRPVYLHRVVIGIGRDGYPLAWQHRLVGQSLFASTPFAGTMIQQGIDYSSVDGLHESPYVKSLPAYSIELHTTSLKVPVLPWRAVGNTHTAFVMETLIDELAGLAGKDPVIYRRTLLRDHPRHLAALDLAARKAGWGSALPAGHFQGVAVHAAMGSFVAQVVEISITERQLRIHRVVCAIDCGLAVNPDGVRAQMEGGIVFGLTAALYGEITLEKGRVQQSNFHDYPLLRLHETPRIEVYMVQSSESMGGAGEPGVPPVAPALVNAIFAATGKRIRRLPVAGQLKT